MTKANYRFDYAISYAGSDSEVAKKLYSELTAVGFSVFIDEAYEQEILGEDGSLYFRNVFSKESRFCIVLISQEYDSREWPNMERESIQGRELRGERGAFLPIQLDSHRPAWLPETRIYFDLTTRSMSELIGMLTKKAAISAVLNNNKVSEGRFYESGFSDEPLSKGLRTSITKFYSDVRQLTINQINALNASLKHRHLWIEGDAGTGKTIFAIETAYRSLNAGHSVLFVYRTSQFRDLLHDLLGGLNAPLYTLDHNSFMWLLITAQTEGFGSSEFWSLFSESFKEIPESQCDQLPFAQLILDDFPTYSERVHDFLDIIDLFAYKVTVISSLQQLQNGILLDTPPSDEGCLEESYEEMGLDWESYISEADGQDIVVKVTSRGELKPSGKYHVELFDTNVRNAKRISEYAAGFSENNNKIGVVSQGMVVPLGISLQHLECQLLEIIDELLTQFQPSSIKILVDPFFTQNRGLDLSEFGALTKLIFQAAKETDYRHSSFEVLDECKKRLSEEPNRTAIFMATNGGEFAFIGYDDVSGLSTTKRIKSRFLDSFDLKTDQAILCDKLLSDSALDEKGFNLDVITIYPGPLYIGLESDVVIYIRNREDLFAYYEDAEPGLIKDVEGTRNVHHYLAMTRAKYILYDVMISTDEA